MLQRLLSSNFSRFVRLSTVNRFSYKKRIISNSCLCVEVRKNKIMLRLYFHDYFIVSACCCVVLQSFAAAVAFYYSNVLLLQWQLLILVVFCVCGTISFFIVEWRVTSHPRSQWLFHVVLHIRVLVELRITHAPARWTLGAADK